MDAFTSNTARRHARVCAPSRAVTAYLEVSPVPVQPDVSGRPPASAPRERVVPLHDEVVIGRDLPAGSRPEDAGSDGFLCIPDHTVSRRHARISRRGVTYYIEDLHSVNGTFVGGNRLAPGAMQALRDGEELAVATITMVFHSLVAAPQAAAPSLITSSVDATHYARTLDAQTQAELAPDDLQRVLRRLRAMAQVSIALGVVRDRATLIEKIMNFIFELFPLAERAFILMQDTAGKRLIPGGDVAIAPDAARRRDGAVVDPRQVRLSRTIVREVVERKQSILSVDTLADRHLGMQESIVAQPIRSVMCVPMLLENECLGLIQVDTSSDPYAFKEQDLEMLTGVCAETAVTLKTFQLYSDIERLLDGFVRASVQAIEERDPVTAGHSFRVADYAESLAQAVDRCTTPALRGIGFNRDQLREIRYAALLHDFGKVGVREHVLRKEKKLHHADLRLLEQRFETARANLERQAWRDLVTAHAAHPLTRAAFGREQARIEAYLAQEFFQLEQFMAAIQCANEPAVSFDASRAGHAALQEIAEFRFPLANGSECALLEPFEFSALNVARGCLTPDERRQIEAHVADSYAFLVLIPWTHDLAGVPAIAHGHHEKLDGSGYPRGLRGDDINVQTRILTICDIFDALTAADRPYKKAVPVPQALELMREECRNGHLDSGLFEVFVESQAWSTA